MNTIKKLPLPTDLRERLLVRLYMHDYGWDQEQRWIDRWPSISLDNGQVNMQELLPSCRLLVSTYNATTYLESFSLDIPTVLFWDPKYWEERESAKPFLDRLRSIGVLHDSPESAAAHIHHIWPMVEEWWHSESVVSAVKMFCSAYCNTDSDVVERIANVMEEATSN